MIKKLASLSHKTLFIILILLVAVGAVVVLRGNSNKVAKAQYPEYFNFDGNYVFSVPKDYSVDEQSAPGAQLVYSGQISVKTVEDVYNQKGIALQAISELTDHSGKAFKDYVNGKYLADLKSNLSTNDVKIKFGKANGSDNARVIVKKDGQQIRFIYLKGGQHPVAVISKQETDPFKNIESSLKDIEKSDLKGEVDPIKQSIKTTGQLIKDQKAHDLYAAAAADLRTKSTETGLASALSAAQVYTNGNIVISGISYTPNGFSATMRFTKLDKNDQQPAFGALTYKKIDGQWKLEALSLPTPKQ